MSWRWLRTPAVHFAVLGALVFAAQSWRGVGRRAGGCEPRRALRRGAARARGAPARARPRRQRDPPPAGAQSPLPRRDRGRRRGGRLRGGARARPGRQRPGRAPPPGPAARAAGARVGAGQRAHRRGARRRCWRASRSASRCPRASVSPMCSSRGTATELRWKPRTARWADDWPGSRRSGQPRSGIRFCWARSSRRARWPSSRPASATSFARAVDALPPGRWSGPIASSYGLHRVFVQERTPGARGAPRGGPQRAARGDLRGARPGGARGLAPTAAPGGRPDAPRELAPDRAGSLARSEPQPPARTRSRRRCSSCASSREASSPSASACRASRARVRC